MNRLISAAFMVLVGLGMAQSALAFPVSYNFTTTTVSVSSTGQPIVGTNNSGSLTTAELNAINALRPFFPATSVSGSFQYDSAAPLAQQNADGSVNYSANPNSSFINLSGVIFGGSFGTGQGFTDAHGFTQIGNETQKLGFQFVDIFSLRADSSSPSGGNKDLVRFQLGGFEFYNVRLFWIEGQATPEVIPDLFSNQLLPAAPPTMHGRLALDFVELTDPSGTQYSLFYDRLQMVAAVPEPAPLALILLGWLLISISGERASVKKHLARDCRRMNRSPWRSG